MRAIDVRSASSSSSITSRKSRGVAERPWRGCDCCRTHNQLEAERTFGAEFMQASAKRRIGSRVSNEPQLRPHLSAPRNSTLCPGCEPSASGSRTHVGRLRIARLSPKPVSKSAFARRLRSWFRGPRNRTSVARSTAMGLRCDAGRSKCASINSPRGESQRELARTERSAWTAARRGRDSLQDELCAAMCYCNASDARLKRCGSPLSTLRRLYPARIGRASLVLRPATHRLRGSPVLRAHTPHGGAPTTRDP